MAELKDSPKNLPDTLDLQQILIALWGRRFLVMGSSLLGLALAAIYAFLIAKPVFVSSALLLPTHSPTPDQFSAAASLLGEKTASSGDVELYQSLLTSRTVMQKLLLTPIEDLSDTGNGRRTPLFLLLGVDTSNRVDVEEAIKSLTKSILVDSKETGAGGILQIRFWANAPWLAKQLGTAVLEIGQEELRLVRIQRSELILERLKIAIDESHAEWDSTARKLAEYKDMNRSTSLPAQALQIARLEMERSAKEQRYLLARKEYELELLERAKAAPPMMILDPANLPAKKAKPRRSLILALGLVLGCFGSSAWIIALRSFLEQSPNDLLQS